MGRKSKISSSNTAEQASNASAATALNGSVLVPPPMNDVELLHQFDACTSSSSPEEGIQAARELYIVVVTRREALRRGITLLQEEKENLDKKCNEVATKNETEAGEVRRLLAQKERLVVLANELTKQKEAAIASTTTSTPPATTTTIDDLSRRINEVSSALEEVGRQRVATATTNDQLRDTLRSMLNKSQAEETATSTTLATKATRLAEVTAALESAIANTTVEKEQTPILQSQANELSAKEEALRSSLQEYAERFEHFQSSLNKSNELFSSFKRRMDEMARTISTYNKENGDLDTRAKEMTTTISSMKQEKTLLDEEVARVERVNTRLAALVEALSSQLGISPTAGCSPYCTCRCGAPLNNTDVRNPLEGDFCVATSNSSNAEMKEEEKDDLNAETEDDAADSNEVVSCTSRV